MNELAPIGPPDIVRLIQRRALPLGDEKILQAQMAHEFTTAGIIFEREKHLSHSDIVDFLTDAGIAIEVKIKGGKFEIYRQCERYCMHEEVRALVLATAVAMALPTTINGKPAMIASLGRGWL